MKIELHFSIRKLQEKLDVQFHFHLDGSIEMSGCVDEPLSLKSVVVFKFDSINEYKHFVYDLNRDVRVAFKYLFLDQTTSNEN